MVERRRARSEARVRAGAVRPSALDRLLARAHRRAEGDRPRTRRDRDRTPQDAAPAHRTCARATVLLGVEHGWIVWTLLVSGLLGGCTIVMFDGNPAYPDAGEHLAARRRDARRTHLRLRRRAHRRRAMKAGVEPGKVADLSRLRVISTTGLAARRSMRTSGRTRTLSATSGSRRSAAAPTSPAASSPAVRCCR